MDIEWIDSAAVGFIIGIVFLTMVLVFVLGPDEARLLDLGGCKPDFIDGQDACKYHNPNENRYKLENGTVIVINRG